MYVRLGNANCLTSTVVGNTHYYRLLREHRLNEGWHLFQCIDATPMICAVD